MLLGEGKCLFKFLCESAKLYEKSYLNIFGAMFYFSFKQLKECFKFKNLTNYNNIVLFFVCLLITYLRVANLLKSEIFLILFAVKVNKGKINK